MKKAMTNDSKKQIIDATLISLNKMRSSFQKTAEEMADNPVFSNMLQFLFIQHQHTITIIDEYIKQYEKMRQDLE